MTRLVIAETHPVQYHAPVWRTATQKFGVPLQVIYGGDFSVQGYTDREFGASFQWDVDLMSGYDNTVLHPKTQGGPASYDQVTPAGQAAALATAKPTALLVQGYYHPWDRAALAWAKRHQVPILFRGETSDVAQPRRSLIKSWLRDLWLKRLYRQCFRCLYLGVHSRRHYERLGVPAHRLVHAPYCVNTEAFQLAPDERRSLRTTVRQQLQIPDDALVLVFSGKLSWRKGVDMLPSAVRRLPESLRQRLVLLFLGAGELESELRSACAQSPTVEARFTGFQNQSKLSGYYHASDLLILPSREGETWGLVVNDALHHGLPCVVSDSVGSAPDLVTPGSTGEVFTAGNATDLAAALERCITWLRHDPIRTAALCQARAEAYSVTRAAQGVAEAFQQAVNQPR